MAGNFLHTTLTVGIALVWLINGLYCKLLNFVPRHRQIVARIYGPTHAAVITHITGALELAMFIWVFSNIGTRLCAIVQIVLIAAMNTVEYFKAQDLLLFGKRNAIFATLFILLICYNEFFLG